MATRERAIAIGKTLVGQHGLSGWVIAVQGHNTDPCLGRCDYTKKKLSIETYAADLMSEKEVRGIWLHEIAHALIGPDHGHDADWERRCTAIGGIASPSYSPKQIKAIFLNCREMMDELLTLSGDKIREARNVYSPIAASRNAVSADHSLRLVLAAYKALTQGEASAAVAESLNLPPGSVAAVRAWNTMWKQTIVNKKAAQNGK